MERIIDRVDRNKIKQELTPERLLRKSNKGDNEVYIVDAFNAPNTMREIGRQREIAFRDAGGGTGLDCDIDEFDTMDVPCRQLIVWDPADEEIVGGYRFILGRDIKVENGVPRIATSHMFNFSKRFIEQYLPHTLELTVVYPEIKYLFGKVTMYPAYGEECRDLLLGFLHKYFHDPDQLVTPIEPLPTKALSEEVQSVFSGESFKEDYKLLNHAIRSLGQNIPPLVNAYMSLSNTMRMFGTAVNHEFGEVEESGIFFKVEEIFEEKKRRHIHTFHQGYDMKEESSLT